MESQPNEGCGINIAMVDAGTDNEHPGLKDKFMAGYDAVCFVQTQNVSLQVVVKPMAPSIQMTETNTVLRAWEATATGLDANGEQTGFEGSAPNASLIDVKSEQMLVPDHSKYLLSSSMSPQ